MISAGKMRHYATVQHFVRTGTGARGQKTGAWLTLAADIPCSFIPIHQLRGGKLDEIAMQRVPVATHFVTIRWLEGIKAGECRLLFEGRYFNVGYVDEGDFKHHELALTCTEVAEDTLHG